MVEKVVERLADRVTLVAEDGTPLGTYVARRAAAADADYDDATGARRRTNYR